MDRTAMSSRKASDTDELTENGSAVRGPSGVRLSQLPLTPGSGDAALNDQLRIHSALLDQTQDAILVRDLEDRILSWKKAAERLYGWQANEALGQNIYALLDLRHVAAFG